MTARTSDSSYRKTSDRRPRPVQIIILTVGLYPRPGVYAGSSFYPKLYGMLDFAERYKCWNACSPCTCIIDIVKSCRYSRIFRSHHEFNCSEKGNFVRILVRCLIWENWNGLAIIAMTLWMSWIGTLKHTWNGKHNKTTKGTNPSAAQATEASK